MAYTPNADDLNRPVGSDLASGLTGELQSLKQKLAATSGDMAADITNLQTSLASVIDQIAELNSIVLANAVPIGFIACGPFETLPTNWLLMDGGILYSRTTYLDLWQYILNHYTTVDDSQRDDFPGAFTRGDGTTNFRLPNMANLVVRGYHESSEALSGARGELQMDAILDHLHVYHFTSKGSSNPRSAWAYSYKRADGGQAQTKNTTTHNFGATTSPIITNPDADNTFPSYAPKATENRMRNTAWRWVIRAL